MLGSFARVTLIPVVDIEFKISYANECETKAILIKVGCVKKWFRKFGKTPTKCLLISVCVCVFLFLSSLAAVRENLNERKAFAHVELL